MHCTHNVDDDDDDDVDDGDGMFDSVYIFTHSIAFIEYNTKTPSLVTMAFQLIYVTIHSYDMLRIAAV